MELLSKIKAIAECKARVNQYDKMLLFSQAYSLEDSFDFEGMVGGLHNFKQMVDRFQQNLADVLSAHLILSNEGCGQCPKCTYPDAPCRFPQSVHHSLEGYGFAVNELAKEAGIRYNIGQNTVTYFGALLFRTEENQTPLCRTMCMIKRQVLPNLSFSLFPLMPNGLSGLERPLYLLPKLISYS